MLHIQGITSPSRHRAKLGDVPSHLSVLLLVSVAQWFKKPQPLYAYFPGCLTRLFVPLEIKYKIVKPARTAKAVNAVAGRSIKMVMATKIYAAIKINGS